MQCTFAHESKETKVKANFFYTFIFGLIAASTYSQERITTAGSAITERVCAFRDCDKIIASDGASLYPAYIQWLLSNDHRGASTWKYTSLNPTLIIAEIMLKSGDNTAYKPDYPVEGR